MIPFISNKLININYDHCYSYKVHNNLITMEVNENMTCERHKKADTKLVHHVCKIKSNTKTNVFEKSRDTDVLLIVLENMDHLDSDHLNIFMEYGTGNKRRFINITQLYAKFGEAVCRSFPRK